MQLVPLQRAIREALAEHLSSALEDHDVVVYPSWPEDERLPAKAISVLDRGPRRTEWLDPMAMSTAEDEVSTPEHPKVLVTWKLGIATQPLQLDVWAQTEAALEDLIARLDSILNQGTTFDDLSDPVEPGLLLQLGGAWAPGTTDILFGEPDTQRTASSVGEGEWRATYRGEATAMLTATASSPRMARILVHQRLADGDVQTTTVTQE